MTYEEAIERMQKWRIKYIPTCNCALCTTIQARGGLPEDKAPIASAPAAIDATLQDRGKTYGNFLTQSVIALNIQKAMADSPNWSSLAADQREALDMIAVKIARILNGNPNFHDSWHDISGYAKLVADRLTP